MTLTDLLDEVRDRGWLVSNLFQRDDGTWQANLRTATHHTEYGKGPSPELALSLAIEAIETATETWREATRINTDHLPDTGSFDLVGLLANLRPQVTFRGRLP